MILALVARVCKMLKAGRIELRLRVRRGDFTRQIGATGIVEMDCSVHRRLWDHAPEDMVETNRLAVSKPSMKVPACSVSSIQYTKVAAKLEQPLKSSTRHTMSEPPRQCPHVLKPLCNSFALVL